MKFNLFENCENFAAQNRQKFLLMVLMQFLIDVIWLLVASKTLDPSPTLLEPSPAHTSKAWLGQLS